MRIERLPEKAVKAITAPGRHADGGGLYLTITGAGGRSWTFLYRWQGKPNREIGLGSVADVSLAQARQLAAHCRGLVAQGINPKDERQATRAAEKAAAVTFGDCVTQYIEAHRPEWKTKKHAGEWIKLEDHAAGIWHKPVGAVDVDAVLGVLNKIWSSTRETASRVRSRIECVLDYARVKGYRTGDNPARWKGMLEHSLAAAPTKKEQKHHAAMSYKAVPGFMLDLKRYGASVPARALEFTILTAARTGETLGARWQEIRGDVWTIPAERMKAGVEHSVPLGKRALAILDEMKKINTSDYIFPGRGSGKPLGPVALQQALKLTFGVTGTTVHGFRSSFRDWCGDETDYPRELAEAALAHTVGGVEGAYRRGRALDKRRELMLAWERYCYTDEGAQKHS